MSVVVVEPEQFEVVQFSATRIAAIARKIMGDLGLRDLDATVRVDEASPLVDGRVASLDPLILEVRGGAFEDQARPRHMSEARVEEELSRLLQRVADRLHPGFADAPLEQDLTAAAELAWDASALGRAERRGVVVHRPRCRYRFLLRHGFTDVAQAAFDRLWAADAVAWADIAIACDETAPFEPEPAPASQVSARRR